MKKLVGLVVAGLLIGAHSAEAMPTMKFRMTQSSATACTTMSNGVFSPGLAAGTYLGGGTCEWTTTGGVINLAGSYGSFFLNQELNVGVPAAAPPALWMNSTNSSTVAGSITMELVGMNYSSPGGTFPLLTTTSGTVHPGAGYQIDAFFDAANTGVAGAGINVMTEGAITPGSIAGNIINNVTNSGMYSVSWVLTITRFGSGPIGTVGINAEMMQAAPAPGALALIGLGLLGLGALRRRVK